MLMSPIKLLDSLVNQRGTLRAVKMTGVLLCFKLYDQENYKSLQNQFSNLQCILISIIQLFNS